MTPADVLDAAGQKERWITGAPTTRGSYWVVWQRNDGARIVIPVDISGAAYDFAANRSRITHHMPLVAPGQPESAARWREEHEG